LTGFQNRLGRAFFEVTTGVAPIRLNVQFTDADTGNISAHTETLGGHFNAQPRGHVDQSAPLTAAPSGDVATGPPVYKMSRHHDGIGSLIQEWTDGIGGGPSVRDLERAWGTSWRKDPTESKFFSRRKPIFDQYEHLLTGGHTSAMAMQSLALTKTANGGSLDSLQKFLRIQGMFLLRTCFYQMVDIMISAN
jgi:hypothetical protein